MMNSKIKNNHTMVYILLIIVMFLFCRGKDDLQKGISAVQKGDYEKALQPLNAALKSDSLNIDIHYNLSLSYAYLDSVSKALTHYLRLTELDTMAKYEKDTRLKEILATFLQIDPYVWKNIPMKRMNQFKGLFSPDGKTIAVAAASRDVANIYLIKINGQVVKKITASGMNTDPDFSPDGEQIVFVSNVDGDDELYLYDLKSEKIDKLTDNARQDFSPSFSPDGKDIVFVSNMDDPYKWEIYKIDVVRKKIKRLTKNNFWDGFPKYSADGKAIVYSSKRNGSENIYKMKTGGGGEDILYQSESDDNDPILIGDILYFKSNRDGEWEIYRYNLKNKRLFRLTYNKLPDWNPRISKDGSRIIIARKIKKRWCLYYIDFTDPVSTQSLVRHIEKKLAHNE